MQKLIAAFLLLTIFSFTSQAQHKTDFECPIVGIQLGDSNVVASVYRDGEVVTIGTNFHDHRLAYLAILSNQEFDPENLHFKTPSEVFPYIRNFVGKTHDDPQVQALIPKVPYKVVNHDNYPYIQVNKHYADKELYSPEEVLALVFDGIKRAAKYQLQKENIDAVVAVPASFDDSQRAGVKKAGEIAGISIRRIVNEATLSAIANDLDKIDDTTQILVVDVGKNKMKATVLEVEDGVFELMSESESSNLSGNSIDKKLMDLFLGYIQSNYRTDITEN